MKLIALLAILPIFTFAKPNIVFILADDLGIKDLSIEGSTFYETPHIDAIAKTGMRFSMATRPVRSVRHPGHPS